MPALLEVIYAAKHRITPHFPLFVALALLNTYRDEIVDRNMDFVAITQFYKGEHCYAFTKYDC